MRAVEEASDDLEPGGGLGNGALNVGPADAYSTEPTTAILNAPLGCADDERAVERVDPRYADATRSRERRPNRLATVRAAGAVAPAARRARGSGDRPLLLAMHLGGGTSTGG